MTRYSEAVEALVLRRGPIMVALVSHALARGMDPQRLPLAGLSVEALADICAVLALDHAPVDNPPG